MRKLRQHQQEGVDFLMQSQYLGGLLWHGMGLGKTTSSLTVVRAILAHLRSNGVRAPKFLVLMPKSAVKTWRDECLQHFRDIYSDMIMLPYSQMHKAKALIRMYDVRVLIEDESHYLKSPETDRIRNYANLLGELGQSPGGFNGGKIIKLTGTPMLNHAAELYTSWAVCATKNIYQSKTQVEDLAAYTKWQGTFANVKESVWTSVQRDSRGRVIGKRSGIAQNFEGIKNPELLHQLLQPVVHFRRVSDCIDLPDKLEIPVNLGLPDDKLLQDADITKPDAYMSIVERLSVAKTPHMLTWVDDFIRDNNAQLVVFSTHTAPLEALKHKFKNKVELITGAQSKTERDSTIGKFQRGELQVCGLTYGAGAESLNFQNCCFALYHGYPWTDGKLKQAMARIYRSGQANKTFHYFLTSGENDTRVLGLVRSKEEATTTMEDIFLGAEKGIITPPAVSLDTFI